MIRTNEERVRGAESHGWKLTQKYEDECGVVWLLFRKDHRTLVAGQSVGGESFSFVVEGGWFSFDYLKDDE